MSKEKEVKETKSNKIKEKEIQEVKETPKSKDS